jgi:hypothetical protein
MRPIKSATQTRTLSCDVCGPQLVSWKWRCSDDTEITCPTCGKGLGITVGKVRDELQDHGWRAVKRILRRR